MQLSIEISNIAISGMVRKHQFRGYFTYYKSEKNLAAQSCPVSIL